MTAPIALPGTLRDLLAVGMSVTEHTDWLHDEFDPEVWVPPGGIVHAIGDGVVGCVRVGRPHWPDGISLDVIPIERIHQCDDDTCLYRPAVARAADVRYAARWLLRIVGGRSGRIGPPDAHDRRLIHIAVALYMKGLV